MKQRWLQIGSGLVVALAAMNWLSCGQDHKLVAIEIQPAAGFTFLTPDPAGQVVFTAIGSYVHPPGTADITSQVTWKTDIPQLLTVSGGVVSPVGGCGIADVYATMNSRENFVTNSAPVTVEDPTKLNCPGGSTTQAAVTVSLAPRDGGMVTSVPAGIACPAICGAQFTVGSTISLTAAPNTGHTFNLWSGCTTSNGTACTIKVPLAGANVSASFN